jgi:hypothetical protein
LKTSGHLSKGINHCYAKHSQGENFLHSNLFIVVAAKVTDGCLVAYSC